VASKLARISTILAALVLAGLAGAEAGASPGVNFSLEPSNQTVAVGQVFTIDIRVDASDQELDIVQAHVDFDARYLETVDGAGNLSTGSADDVIVPGAITKTMLTATLPWPDYTSGHVDVAYGIPPPPTGTPVNESFILVTMRFKAVGVTTGTVVSFNRANPRMTQAVRSGTDVTGDLTGATVVITAASTQQDEPSQTDEDAASLVAITSPGDGTVTSDPVLVVTGTVSDTSITTATLNVTTLTVSRLRLITVAIGSFEEEVTLTSGINTISVSVTDPAGNKSTARIEVTLSEEPVADAEPDTEAVAETAAAEAWAPAEEEDSEKPLTWPMMGGIIGGVLVIGLLVYFLASRSRF